MISGMYMGELVRLAIYRFCKEGLLFIGIDSEMLRTRDQFLTKYVSEIESDEPGTFTKCMKVMENLGLPHATAQDCINVRYICECVSSRAASLVSAGIAALINKIDELSVTVRIYSNFIWKQRRTNIKSEMIGRCRWFGLSISSNISRSNGQTYTQIC